MSGGIEERITEVLTKHRFEQHSVIEPGYHAWWGHCTGCGFDGDRRNSHYAGWELDMRDDEAWHAAAVLVAELGLTQEWRAEADGTHGQPHPTRDAAEATLSVIHRNNATWERAKGKIPDFGRNPRVVSRYVSAWETAS